MTNKKFMTPEEAFAGRTERHGDCLIWTGARSSDGYAKMKAGGKVRTVTRWLWEKEHGPIPEGMRVDHAFHCDTACVEISHLRLATPSQNAQNRKGPRTNSKTGVRNVYPHGNKFRVIVTKDGVLGHYGTYSTVQEAAEVAEKVRRELFGTYAGRG